MAQHPVLHLHAGNIHIGKLLFQIVVFCIIFYVFASQLSSLQASRDALMQANLRILGLALVAVSATFLVAAGTYYVLSGLQYRYLSILKVQIASGFANRLLPAGLGGMSLYTFYFRQNGYTLPQATALVTTNNIIGIITNILLVSVMLIINPHFLDKLRFPEAQLATSVLFVGIAAGVIFLLFWFRNNRFIKYVIESVSAVKSKLRVNRSTITATICSMFLTSLNVLALSLCVLSVQGTLQLSEALLILSAGTLLGAVVPTPGGIGGVEAGLLAGMTAFGIPPATGFAAVFLYRGLTYWVPILPGLLAFYQLRRRYA